MEYLNPITSTNSESICTIKKHAMSTGTVKIIATKDPKPFISDYKGNRTNPSFLPELTNNSGEYIFTLRFKH